MSIRVVGSGGMAITDATAVPGAVRSGDVFYNNDGRQVGTNPDVKISMTKVVQYTGSLSYVGPLESLYDASYDTVDYEGTDYEFRHYRTDNMVTTSSKGKEYLSSKYSSAATRSYYLTTSQRKGGNSSSYYCVGYAMAGYAVNIPLKDISNVRIGNTDYGVETNMSCTDYVLTDQTLGTGTIYKANGSSPEDVVVNALISAKSGMLTYIGFGAFFSESLIRYDKVEPYIRSITSVSPITITYKG